MNKKYTNCGGNVEIQQDKAGMYYLYCNKCHKIGPRDPIKNRAIFHWDMKYGVQ